MLTSLQRDVNRFKGSWLLLQKTLAQEDLEEVSQHTQSNLYENQPDYLPVLLRICGGWFLQYSRKPFKSVVSMNAYIQARPRAMIISSFCVTVEPDMLEDIVNIALTIVGIRNACILDLPLSRATATRLLQEFESIRLITDPTCNDLPLGFYRTSCISASQLAPNYRRSWPLQSRERKILEGLPDRTDGDVFVEVKVTFRSDMGVYRGQSPHDHTSVPVRWRTTKCDLERVRCIVYKMEELLLQKYFFSFKCTGVHTVCTWLDV